VPAGEVMTARSAKNDGLHRRSGMIRMRRLYFFGFLAGGFFFTTSLSVAELLATKSALPL
jgi:hypothetical protein